MLLKDGITYSHEHVRIDLSHIKGTQDTNIDIFEDTVEEFLALKHAGVANILELTNIGMGRDTAYVRRVADASGLNILCSTGFYIEEFFPDFFFKMNEREVADLLVKEVVYGIEDTGVKAEIIGEIGSSLNVITEEEKKLFKAAARASCETGKPIITHATLGTCGLEQVDILKGFSLDFDKIIISHIDLKNDLDYAKELIYSGVNIAFDTIGKENYLPDSERVNLIKELCKLGLSEKILLSMDITRKSAFKSGGGIGYSYLIDHFLPMLRENSVKEECIKNMTENNAKRIFSGHR